MKKLISLLMVLTLVVGLFGCLGVAASAAEDYEFTFLVASAAGAEDYSGIADVRTAYIQERGDAMLVSVDAGGDAASMYAAGFELACSSDFNNYFTCVYPDGGTYDYDNQGTTWVEIDLPVGGEYADEEGYATVFFVAVGGENDAETLASFAEAEGYVVAIGPWSAAEAVEEATDIEMFWTVVDSEDDLAALAEDGYMIGETLVVNAGSTADTAAVVSIANGVISQENLTAAAADTGSETSPIAVTSDTAVWTPGSTDGLTITLAEAVTPETVTVGDTTLTEGTDYDYNAETPAVTISSAWLDTLDAGEYTITLTDENENTAAVTLTVTESFSISMGFAANSDVNTLTLTVEGYDVTITWTKDSSDDAPFVTCADVVESLALYNGDTLLQDMTQGTDYTLSEDGTVITFTADWLNGLFEDETVSALIQAETPLTVVPTFAEPVITLESEDEAALSWEADSAEDLAVTLGSGSTLASVTADGAALTEGSDYRYDSESQTVTFDSTWLGSLDVGTHTIVLSASASGIALASEDDTTVTITLTVTAPTANTEANGTEANTATISTDTTEESWSLGGTGDLTVTLGAGSTLSGVTVGDTALTQGTEYDYDESTLTLTIYASYLNTLSAGDYTITLTAGTDASATIALSAVAVSSISVTSAAAAWTNGATSDLTITLGSAVTLDSVKVGDTALTESTQYTYDGDVTVTILADYLNGLEAGTYTVTLAEDSGNTASVTLTVEAAAATASPSPTPTATAAATATPSPSATPSYTYTWSRGSNSSTLTVDLGKSVSQIDIYSGSSVWKTAALNEDYTLSGTAITFNATMVNNDDGTLFWGDGTYHLVVTFTDSTTQDIYLVLTDGVASTSTATATSTAAATATAPATSTSSSPDTGDTTNIGLYVVVFIVFVVALAVVIIIVMKNRKR